MSPDLLSRLHQTPTAASSWRYLLSVHEVRSEIAPVAAPLPA